MKKLIAVVLSVFVIASVVYAGSMSVSSQIRYDGTVYSGDGLLKMIVVSYSSPDCQFKVYDGSASGKALTPEIKMTLATQDSRIFNFGDGIPFNSGIYVDVTGDKTYLMFYYEAR